MMNRRCTQIARRPSPESDAPAREGCFLASASGSGGFVRSLYPFAWRKSSASTPKTRRIANSPPIEKALLARVFALSQGAMNAVSAGINANPRARRAFSIGGLFAILLVLGVLALLFRQAKG